MALTPQQVVNTMMANDRFSHWLGIDVMEAGPGSCKLRMCVTGDMLNGFGIAHGGITYSFSDSALAFASNSHGKKAVSIETSISHLKPVQENDELVATAREISRTNHVGVYEVTVTNQKGETVSVFKGTVYITARDW